MLDSGRDWSLAHGGEPLVASPRMALGRGGFVPSPEWPCSWRGRPEDGVAAS